MNPTLYDLSLPELSALLESWGEKPYRARQIWQGAYRNLWDAPEAFSNLPSALRARLGERLDFQALQPVTQLESGDGQTVKTLFRLRDGQLIEAVLMKYGETPTPGPSPARKRGVHRKGAPNPAPFGGGAKGRGKIRRTLCISTQAGCAMGCTFCATGQMGFRRNLSSGEIVAQVLYYARQLAAGGERVTNVVVMGMGEPFHNYENTLTAIARLNDPQGFNLGARRFTVSTVGLVPQIRRFAEEQHQVGLAISLHAADNDLRASMLPIARKYPLPALMEAVRYYVERTRRRVTFEWALIDGVNDTPEAARQLAALLKQYLPVHLTHVNAIPLNPTENFRGRATSRKQARLFRDTLEKNGISCTIRLRRGIDIQAGCGQLAVRAGQEGETRFQP